jgi:hypothetical protein
MKSDGALVAKIVDTDRQHTLGCNPKVAPKLQEWLHWTLAESSKFFHVVGTP